ncbi:MAG: hypothetical protein ACYCZ2_02735 [Lutibacter sp.]
MQYEINHLKNSKYVIFVFLGVLFFQSTMLKFIWSIEIISRIYNSLVLSISLLFAAYIVLSKNFSGNIWKQYLIPGVFVLVGMTLNILINALSNITLLNQLGLILPWVLFITIPFLVRNNMINVFSLWKASYYFMLVFVILGLIDYYLIYYLGGPAEILKTPYGLFYIGRFSILHATDFGPHFRFYACFAEPGTLAMLLLSYIIYAFLYKKYIGMIILLAGFFFTFSLGGYLGLLLISVLVYLYKTKKKNMLLSLLSTTLILGLAYGYVSSTISEQYQMKGASATEREESFSNGILNLPKLIVKYPFGMPLAETTDSLSENEMYTGSNFIPLLYFQSGGLLSLVGYILILIMSLKFAFKIFLSKRNYKTEYVVAALTLITMIPFLFQRTTIWENSMFALLYAPLIIDSINKEI